MSTTHKLKILVIVGFLIYLPSFWNHFLWDDEQFIYRNQFVINFDLPNIFSQNTIAGAGEISDYYRPLTTLSFAIDHAVWGLRPFGFHLTNTLLHISAGALLFLLLTNLGVTNFNHTKHSRWWSALTNDPSWWIALFFLTHPIQTEAVVYTNSRGDSWYTLFSFLGSWLLTLAVSSQPLRVKIGTSHLQLSRNLVLGASLVCYPLAILSKEIGLASIGLYGLILGKIWLVNGHKYSPSQILRLKIMTMITAMILISVASGYLLLRTTWLNFDHSFTAYSESSIYTDHLWVRLATFSKVVWIYFSLLLVPVQLHMERTTTIIASPWTLWPVATIMLLFILIFSGGREWLKQHTIWIWLGTAWFFGMLLPVSGILPINGLLYEHWLYVPMVGYWLIIWRLFTFLPMPKLPSWKQIRFAALVTIVVGLSVLTLRQNWRWRHPIPFYSYLLQYTQSARIYNNLAMAYADDRQPDQAVEFYLKAIEYADAYPQTHYNLARTYLELGETESAIAHLERAIQMSPQFYLAHELLLASYLQSKNFDQALAVCSTLTDQFPTNLNLQLLKLRLLVDTNQPQLAHQQSEIILARESTDSQLTTTVREILQSAQP